MIAYIQLQSCIVFLLSKANSIRKAVSDMQIKEIANSTWAGRWPLERALFLMAGSLVLIGSILAAVASPWFLLLTGFVAVNQLLYAVLGACGASLILHRFAGLRPATSDGGAQ